MQELFGVGVSPSNGYGLTETSSGVTGNRGADYRARPSSVGRPVPGTEIRVVDPGHRLDSGNRRDRRAVLPGSQHRPRLLEPTGGHGRGVQGRLVPHRRPRLRRRRGLRLRGRPAQGRRDPGRRERVLRRGRGRAVRAPGGGRRGHRRGAAPGARRAGGGDHPGEGGRDGRRSPSCSSTSGAGSRTSRCPRSSCSAPRPLPRTATGKVLKRDLRDELAARRLTGRRPPISLPFEFGIDFGSVRRWTSGSLPNRWPSGTRSHRWSTDSAPRPLASSTTPSGIAKLDAAVEASGWRELRLADDDGRAVGLGRRGRHRGRGARPGRRRHTVHRPDARRRAPSPERHRGGARRPRRWP